MTIFLIGIALCCFVPLYVGLPFFKTLLLSQIKSDLHENYRISSLGSAKMIQHFKDYPILQVSSQEPSAFSKYDFEDMGRDWVGGMWEGSAWLLPDS